ncbi:hypothetical protein C8D77_11183 [Mesorhizobium loti]|uniref:Uncharacterized protein n=1 Tax=Rhizobium loti TaxID=381 RepID=A0A8E3B2Z1_RHILI|nr:hypothetical protein [Mesorhizobium loti]PWJ88361.1 hypothetical protein C8D77_11183 [Mesorhizobium loti]
MAELPLTVDVAAVNVAQRIAVMDDGATVHLETLLDADGEETDDADEARSAVGQLPDGSWLAVDLTQFETQASN